MNPRRRRQQKNLLRKLQERINSSEDSLGEIDDDVLPQEAEEILEEIKEEIVSEELEAKEEIKEVPKQKAKKKKGS